MSRMLLCLMLLLAGAQVHAQTHAERLTGHVVAIADGDTLTLLVDRVEHRIRLAEIDTPERGQDWGTRARQALAARVFRQDVTVEVIDVDRYGRIVGRVRHGDVDVNRALVADGHAWVYRQYLTDRSLLEDERAARAAGRGLWALPDPIAPWDWRRGDRVAAALPMPVPTSTDDTFSCGSKRYCRDMGTCAEAMFHLQQCGLSRLDGDGDGVPCEALCR